MTRRRTAAFTLIEVLLALALLAALLTAINHFVSITEISTRQRDQFAFMQHARAVARHVGEMLQAASDSARASGVTTGRPAPAEARLTEGGTADLLSFDLPAGDRLMTWPGQPLPEVRCSLGWNRDKGLILYWKSRLETDFATADPRETIISSFVTALSYEYYDDATKTWSSETELQRDKDGALLAPRRLRLEFTRQGQHLEEFVQLPATIQEGLPPF